MTTPNLNSIRRQSLCMLGALCMLVWIGLFLGGLCVSSKNARDDLNNKFTWTAFLKVCLTYTPTNAALLSCLAGLAGGISSNLTYGERIPASIESPRDLARSAVRKTMIRTENPLASMLRSFIVYFLFIAGIAITTEKPFADPSQDQYLRIVGTLSALSFITGFDPYVFLGILRKVPLPVPPTQQTDDRREMEPEPVPDRSSHKTPTRHDRR